MTSERTDMGSQWDVIMTTLIEGKYIDLGNYRYVDELSTIRFIENSANVRSVEVK